MEQNITDIIEILKEHEQKFRDTERLAFKKFLKWYAHSNKIIQESKRNPNIISMAFTTKLVAYSGIIESLKLSAGGNVIVCPTCKKALNVGSRKNFEEFFYLFDEHGKFLVMVVIRLGKFALETSGKEQREEKIVDAYLKNSSKDFNDIFEKTIASLYSLRSRLVHQGEFVLTIISSGDDAILAHFSPNAELMINEKVISLDEMFLRGFCKIVNVEAPSLKSRAEDFLLKNNYYHKTLEYSQLFEAKFNW